MSSRNFTTSFLNVFLSMELLELYSILIFFFKILIEVQLIYSVQNKHSGKCGHINVYTHITVIVIEIRKQSLELKFLIFISGPVAFISQVLAIFSLSSVDTIITNHCSPLSKI